MSIDVTSYLNATSSTTTSSSDSSSEVDYNDYLTLLATELQYQDPTEPMDNTEMINQLTSYSQLEQLTYMSDQLDTLTESIESVTSTAGLDYLGKEVLAVGSSVVVDGGDVTSLGYILGDDAEYVTLNIYDSSGNIVDTTTLGETESGEHVFQWDGQDEDGNAVDDGTYYVAVSAYDSDDASITSSTTASGTVVAVTQSSSGVILTLDDGREVNMLNVATTTASSDS
ncbi:flagellar hook assembly protein FlgD [Pseudodesulfovibrio senegalensis]|jgi:flagellar basal-body rod modification protein FlgD|uniref:Basal-body rod modification protein FlgD n=1 Tax=Pseudodesulfovibrio senegalensis TaxID=1721087 RepID=A0A6N6N5J2_9BACT|nr:flagellar hook assembly protein FlgD [Pseudodesulfovibrio senegalensis]KAB1442156.1 flagellar hook assembly protein FlgD [Pseudodesulfovibrio senegalensis]